jgi:hypothetical protein
MSETKTGTIYKISTPKSEKVYVGSTVQQLCKRMRDHRSSFSTGRCDNTSRELLELGECKIEALEVLYNCTKKELQIMEQVYIELLDCVNKQRSHRTSEIKQKQNQTASLKCYHKKAQDPEFKKQKAEEAKRRRDANPQVKEAYNLKRREARLAKTRNTESS